MSQNTVGTVLVVDDNASIREVLVEMLTINNIKVIEASDGKEGYLALQHNQVDVTLADYVMPRMSGVDLFKKIIEEDIDTEYILLSGLDQHDSTLSLFRKHAVTVIGKPFEVDFVCKLIVDTIEKRKKEKEQEVA